jgi:NAD(P)-dependent dehydrogenase (short-subunit alcohol dehydrogenase family)
METKQTQKDIAIVTGAGSGVGAATVALFRARGIVTFGIDLVEAPTLADAPGEYHHIVGDAGDSAIWDSIITRALSDFNLPPNIVVFNAARLIVGSASTLNEEDWNAVFDVNVFGPARALKRLIPQMASRGGGSVVFVNSSDGLVAEQNLAAYCSSKGAALQLMRAVAIDHARQGIRSNAVCPGSIETPFFMRHVHAAPDPKAFLYAKTQRHPIGRLLQPDDIALAIDFLSSAAASGITGVALPVDGGLTTTFDFYPDQAETEARVSEANS